MRYTGYSFDVPEEKIVRVITNTDAKNEADDPFAVVQTLLSPKFENVGLIAAHYGITRDADSMERSYQELERICAVMDFQKDGLLYRGAPRPMESETELLDSPGARLIVEEAMKEDTRPLYITFLGPLTDLAAAFLLEPRIAGRLIAIWIGGGRYPDGGAEFNLSNDIHAANVVLSSGIEVWQVPKNVYEMIPVSLAELEYRVAGSGKTGKYLFDQLIAHSHEEIPRKSAFRTGETWVLGDNPAPGLILYETRFEHKIIPAPRILPDMTYEQNPAGKPLRVYGRIDSRLILEDLYAKIALFEQHRAAHQ